MASPDLSEAIRDAIVATASITAQLPAYLNSFTVFTRRPVPADAPYPMIVISDDISHSNEDGVNDERPSFVRDVAVYHSNERADFYRTADSIVRELRTLFHRQRSITPPIDWGLVDIQARGPIASANVADKIEGLVVTLTIRLGKGR